MPVTMCMWCSRHRDPVGSCSNRALPLAWSWQSLKQLSVLISSSNGKGKNDMDNRKIMNFTEMCQEGRRRSRFARSE